MEGNVLEGRGTAREVGMHQVAPSDKRGRRADDKGTAEKSSLLRDEGVEGAGRKYRGGQGVWSDEKKTKEGGNGKVATLSRLSPKVLSGGLLRRKL